MDVGTYCSFTYSWYGKYRSLKMLKARQDIIFGAIVGIIMTVGFMMIYRNAELTSIGFVIGSVWLIGGSILLFIGLILVKSCDGERTDGPTDS